MTMISYAQNYEDVILMRALRGVERGFYIDVGAQHPIVDSVTKAFYEKGWQGINIEPVPHWHGLLLQDRPRDINLKVAVSDSDRELVLFEVVDTGLSTTRERYAKVHASDGRMVERHLVECLTLDEIVERYSAGDIHFLKVDAEGAEAAVMRSLSLERHRPWIMAIEATEPNSQNPACADWEPRVLASGYELVYEDGLNRFYLAQERAELKPAFHLPPNYFDFFIRRNEWQALQDVQRLGSESEASARELHQALARESELAHQLQQAHLKERELAHQLQQAHLKERELAQQSIRLGGELEASHVEAGRLAAELDTSRVELSHALDSLRAVRDEFDRFRAMILHSHSWRLTRPLRVVRRLMRQPRTEGRRIVRGLCLPIVRVLVRWPFARWVARHTVNRLPGVKRRLLGAILGVPPEQVHREEAMRVSGTALSRTAEEALALLKKRIP